MVSPDLTSFFFYLNMNNKFIWLNHTSTMMFCHVIFITPHQISVT